MVGDFILIGLRTSCKYTPKDVAVKSGVDEKPYLIELKFKINDAGNLSTIYKTESEKFLQPQLHSTNNNIGAYSKSIVYAVNYFDGLPINLKRKISYELPFVLVGTMVKFMTFP